MTMSLPLDAMICGLPSTHRVGALLAFPRRTSGLQDPLWAIRFDTITRSGAEPWLFFLNGTPFSAGLGPILRCEDSGFAQRAVPAVSSVDARVAVEVQGTAWIAASQINWDEALGFVAMGKFGFWLLGWQGDRTTGVHQLYIDCATWIADPTSRMNDDVTAYASNWQVRVNFSASEHSAVIRFAP